MEHAERIEKLYLSGMSIAKIAAKIGIPSSAVYRTLKERQVPRRPPTAHMPGNTFRKRLQAMPKEVLVSLYCGDGKSVKQIAGELGCGSVHIWRQLKIHGIATRTARDARVLRGHTEVQKARDKTGYHLRGPSNWNWKGGITPEDKKFYTSSKWRKIATACKKRDGFVCQACLKPFDGRNLRAHHIHYRCEGGSDDLSNLISLCNSCHRKRHVEEFRLRGLKFLRTGAFKHPHAEAINCGKIHGRIHLQSASL